MEYTPKIVSNFVIGDEIMVLEEEEKKTYRFKIVKGLIEYFCAPEQKDKIFYHNQMTFILENDVLEIKMTLMEKALKEIVIKDCNDCIQKRIKYSLGIDKNEKNLLSLYDSIKDNRKNDKFCKGCLYIGDK